MTSSTTKDTIKSIAIQNRVLLVIGAVGILSLIVLNIILFIKLLPDSEKYETALGDFPSPVVLNRVPSQVGPAARLGEVTVLQQNRCVNRTTKLIIQTVWTPGKDNPKQSSASRIPLEMNAMKGCSTITMALQMPENITPGNWYITGIVKDEPSGDPRYWTSETFMVVP